MALEGPGAAAPEDRINSLKDAFKDIDRFSGVETEIIDDSPVFDSSVEGEVSAEDEQPNRFSVYSKKAREMALELSNNISQVLMGENFIVYEFSEKDTGIPGLSFSFRSLTSGEEQELLKMFRADGLDESRTIETWKIASWERVVWSIRSINNHINMHKSSLEKRREILNKVPVFVMNCLTRNFDDFQGAVELLSVGKEGLDLVKKSLTAPSTGGLPA